MTGTGGIFANRAINGGRHFMAARRAAGRRKLNAFAEALSQDVTVKDAAASVGVSQQRGSQLLAQIRRELGWQAC
jgi:hypothetical protein